VEILKEMRRNGTYTIIAKVDGIQHKATDDNRDKCIKQLEKHKKSLLTKLLNRG
jgi:hypothetical protein